MKTESLKDKATKGLFWGGISNGLLQMMNLFIGIFLARLLTQEDYGLIGILIVFSAIASALQEGGFISALNKKEKISQKDYNAVFWFSLSCSVSIYLILFFAAPIIADFYEEPRLTPLARYLFLSFIISSLSIAPRAYLFRNLMVKENAIITISALGISGIASITMAVYGFAYWGIATQTIVYVSIITILNFYFSHWKPTTNIDLSPIKDMIGFSSKLVITNVFTIINQNIFSNILGKLYPVSTVGNFTQANKWNNMGYTLIGNMQNSVVQPLMTKIGQEKEQQLTVFNKLLSFTAFLSFPVMLGLSFVSEEFITIAITDRWKESASMLSILCIGGAFMPITNLFSNLMISRGHSSIYMWNTILLCLLQLTSIIATFPWGLKYMIGASVVVNIVWMFIWFIYVHREIGMSLRDLAYNTLPYLCLTTILIVLCHYITADISSVIIRFFAKILFVSVFYIVILWKTDSQIMKECIYYLRRMKQHNYNKQI